MVEPDLEAEITEVERGIKARRPHSLMEHNPGGANCNFQLPFPPQQPQRTHRSPFHYHPLQQVVFQIQYLQPMTNRYIGLHFTASRIGRTAGASISGPSKAVENTFLPML